MKLLKTIKRFFCNPFTECNKCDGDIYRVQRNEYTSLMKCDECGDSFIFPPHPDEGAR